MHHRLPADGIWGLVGLWRPAPHTGPGSGRWCRAVSHVAAPVATSVIPEPNWFSRLLPAVRDQCAGMANCLGINLPQARLPPAFHFPGRRICSALAPPRLQRKPVLLAAYRAASLKFTLAAARVFPHGHSGWCRSEQQRVLEHDIFRVTGSP